ncbi:hypothetical protein P8452_65531 [Trifolium repens]|nr:hypothetical protein P8452_65531 [Trifolium repens]
MKNGWCFPSYFPYRFSKLCHDNCYCQWLAMGNRSHHALHMKKGWCFPLYFPYRFSKLCYDNGYCQWLALGNPSHHALHMASCQISIGVYCNIDSHLICTQQTITTVHIKTMI